MPFNTATAQDVWKLRDELKKYFRTRDRKWGNRRDLRYRRMEKELRSLPLNPELGNTALMIHQSEEPNQEVHKRVKRLVANRPRFEVVLLDSDPKLQSIAQDLENGIKALYKWMNRGKPTFDWLVTEFQQGDGLGIGAEDFLPDHGAALVDYDPDSLEADDEEGDDDGVRQRNKARAYFRESKDSYVKKGRPEAEADRRAYADVTDRALRSERPPFRLRAVDPLACYWWEDGDGISIIAESGKKSLNPLLEALSSYGVKEVEGRLVVTGDGSDAVSSRTAPTAGLSGKDLSAEVEYTEIRTRNEIVILIEHPNIQAMTSRERGKVEDKGIVLRFPNPFGPYTTGYTLVPGDITTETDPADMYQPPTLGILNSTQAINVLATARLSSAVAKALTPTYVEITGSESAPPPGDEDKTPEAQAREIPVIPGKVRRVETPDVDLDKAEARFLGEVQPHRFQDVQLGDAQSEASGHRLAIQVAQADIQMVPYQNNRADAIAELMKGIIFAVKKHGLPIYVPTIPDKSRKGSKVRVSEPAKITPEMADLPFELIVTLGSETPVSKYAKWKAMEEREAAGTVGYLTVIEESDVEDPMDEVARVVEGKVFKAAVEQLVPVMVQQVFEAAMARFQQAITPPAPEAALPGAEMGIDPATGLASGGGGGIGAEDLTRLPGVNQPIAPSTGEYGPPVVEGDGTLGVRGY